MVFIFTFVSLVFSDNFYLFLLGMNKWSRNNYLLILKIFISVWLSSDRCLNGQLDLYCSLAEDVELNLYLQMAPNTLEAKMS